VHERRGEREPRGADAVVLVQALVGARAELAGGPARSSVDELEQRAVQLEPRARGPLRLEPEAPVALQVQVPELGLDPELEMELVPAPAAPVVLLRRTEEGQQRRERQADGDHAGALWHRRRGRS
jgi:hypothetical protein